MTISMNSIQKNRLKNISLPGLLLSIFFIAALSFFPHEKGSLNAAPPYNVLVTNMRFLYGTGKGPTHSPPNNISSYYRGYGMPGTVIELTAEMDVNGVPSVMYGDTVFTVQFTNGTATGTFKATIQSGQSVGTAVIPYNSFVAPALFPTGTTQAWAYSVTAVSGSLASGTITSSPAPVNIYWDNGDYPSDTNFPPMVQTDVVVNTTTSSVRFFWNPVSTATVGIYNEDFYEYRVYYQEQGTTAWKVWNGSNDIALRGLGYNPGTIAAGLNDSTMHFSAGKKYTTIPNLKIFTKYNYYITAVDVFGNESLKPGTVFSVLTQPYSIQIKISDGIKSYSDFTDLTQPQLRPLRETNITVEVHLISSVTEPDFIRIWYTLNSLPDPIIAGSIINASFPANSLYSVVAEKRGPNKWIAYLSTQTPVIRDGNEVRFLVESNFSGVPTYSDKDMTDENPNNNQWNFYIGSKPNFAPWPVRVLNNVLTGRNPVAYPAYYLTDDAMVSIKVYDVKGRPVTTIVENQFRRGGQNIKENGWAGVNKANKKLGIGLYYMHFEAKRASDGKIILNKFQKVVMAY